MKTSKSELTFNDGTCYRCGAPWDECQCGVVLHEETEIQRLANYIGAAAGGNPLPRTSDDDLLPIPTIDWSKPEDDWKPAADDCNRRSDEQSTTEYDSDILPLPELNF